MTAPNVWVMENLLPASMLDDDQIPLAGRNRQLIERAKRPSFLILFHHQRLRRLDKSTGVKPEEVDFLKGSRLLISPPCLLPPQR